jgi:uncharacterized protein
MTKLLLWIVIVFVLLFGLRLLGIAKAKRRAGASGRGPAPGPPAETMVRCARCGIYLPQKDAKPGPAGLTCGDPACTQPR